MNADWLQGRLECAGKVFERLLPWLFLALHRALVTTLTAAAVAVLFFIVPQSREVLYGLTEASPTSWRESVGPSGIRYIAYLLYLFTAVGLGLATWYAARLLCTVDAGSATPQALASGDGAKRLKRSTTWLPRGLGVFVLVAAIGALIFASYTPWLTRWPALALVATVIAGPLLWVGGRIGEHKKYRWAGLLVWTVGLVALVVCAEPHRLNVAVASMFVSLLPAVLLHFLANRRSLLGSARIDQDAGAVRTFAQAINALIAVVLVSIGLLLLLAFLPAWAVRAVGSAAAVLLFLTAGTLFLAGLHAISRHIAQNVAGFTAFVVLVFVILVIRFGDESLGTEALVTQAAERGLPEQSDAFQQAAAERNLYVNAHGGGLRAGAFTAQVLASVDDASCGKFGERIAALSGVSGGSLGIATYLTARQEVVRRGGWKNCQPGAAKVTPLTDIVVAALFQDHLSPVVARMLAVDALHLPWRPLRGQALLDSWEEALMASMDDKLDGRVAGKPSKPIAFSRPLGGLTGGVRPAPAVLFNATDADTGHIVSFTNGAGGQAQFFSATTESRQDASGAIKVLRLLDSRELPALTVGQAVLHSARFPVVSPAGRLDLKRDSTAIAHRLVDGGYSDNSGTTALQRVLNDKPHGASKPWLINIDGNPPPCGKLGASALVTSVLGLLEARSAHASLAVAQFKASTTGWLDVIMDPRDTIAEQDPAIRCEKTRQLRQAPLGWYISRSAARNMAESVRIGVKQLCADLGSTCTAPASKQASSQ